MKYAIVKERTVVNTPTKDVEMYRYEAKDCSCQYFGNYGTGRMATVVKGRKIPKGTEVQILRYREDTYGRSYYSAFFGHLNNPAVLVQLPNGDNVWTIAENLALKPEDMTGYVETVEASSDDEANKCCKEHYESNDGSVYYFDRDGKIKVNHFSYLDAGLSIYNGGKKWLKDCGETYACVLYDWRSDTYSFVVFKKEPSAGNLVKCVDTGTSRRFTDMTNCTGIEDAIDSFNEYVSQFEGV